MSTKITEEVDVDTTIYRSPKDGTLVVEIDTALDEDESIRVFLNDGPLYDGMPASDSSAFAYLEAIEDLLAEPRLPRGFDEDLKMSHNLIRKISDAVSQFREQSS